METKKIQDYYFYVFFFFIFFNCYGVKSRVGEQFMCQFFNYLYFFYSFTFFKFFISMLCVYCVPIKCRWYCVVFRVNNFVVLILGFIYRADRLSMWNHTFYLYSCECMKVITTLVEIFGWIFEHNTILLKLNLLN